MTPETLARWQFGITTVYHFFFVPVTLGLAVLVAFLQTGWYRTGNERYLQLTKFYGKLFLINFAMGVVTGIVQEFQFGMNWSEYSRFVGDIFGAPLALEALLAFFMESTFIGVWIFGWDRLPKKLHLATIWLVALGSTLSAVFILAANSWMQNPVGATYNPVTDRAEMTSFLQVLTNPIMLTTFPHTITAAWMTSGGLVAAIAGWHLARINRSKAAEAAAGRVQVDQETIAKRASDANAFRYAAKFGAWVMIVAGLLVMGTGDLQGKVVTVYQPMKIAAAEGLFEDAGGDGTSAPFAIIAVFNEDQTERIFAIEVPYVLSFLATGNFFGEVKGIDSLKDEYAAGGLVDPANELQAAYAQKMRSIGIDNWVPNVTVSFWSFRLMIGLGMLGLAAGALILWVLRKGRLPKGGPLWSLVLLAPVLGPLFANSFGWILTEMARQPWIVYGVLPSATAYSPGVSSNTLMISMISYTLIYGALAVVEVGLMIKYAKLGLPDVAPVSIKDEDEPLSFTY